jgi:hypothetical protein
MDRVIGFLFFFLVLHKEMLPLFGSRLRETHPPRSLLKTLINYINGVFSVKTRHEEVGVVWCLHQQGMVPGHF